MITLDAITLSPALIWTDRDTWQPVSQTLRRARDGTAVLYHSPMLGGRPITLAGTENQGWISRATLDALQALAATPGNVHSLTIAGTSYSVTWRHDEPPAISAEPLIARINPDAGDWFITNLKFITL